MQNGVNGAAHAPAPVQINPVQAAQFAQMFLQRADMKAGEREMFAIAEALLAAIVSGQVLIGPPAPPPQLKDAPPAQESAA